MHVAAITAPKSMPVVESTAGCTKMMYDIVMNVVSPASTSVRTSVPDSDSRNHLSSDLSNDPFMKSGAYMISWWCETWTWTRTVPNFDPWSSSGPDQRGSNLDVRRDSQDRSKRWSHYCPRACLPRARRPSWTAATSPFGCGLSSTDGSRGQEGSSSSRNKGQLFRGDHHQG